MENLIKMEIRIEVCLSPAQAPELCANLSRLLATQTQDDEVAAAEDRTLVDWSRADVDKALLVYAKLTDDGRKTFDLWMDNAGKPFSMAEIAEKTGMPKGVAGARGALSFPKKYCTEVGRNVVYETDPQTRKHSMNPETAAAFVAARDRYLLTQDQQ